MVKLGEDSRYIIHQK